VLAGLGWPDSEPCGVVPGCMPGSGLLARCAMAAQRGLHGGEAQPQSCDEPTAAQAARARRQRCARQRAFRGKAMHASAGGEGGTAGKRDAATMTADGRIR